MTGQSDDVELRLHDLFDAISSELVAFEPDLRVRRSPRTLQAWRVTVGVAAAAMMFGLGALTVSGPSTIEVTADSSFAAPMPGIDGAVSMLCTELSRSRNGVAPLFRTTDAYLVVVEDRRQSLGMFIESLLDTTPPDDASDLTFTVIADLRRPRELLDDVEQAASNGRLDQAAELWVLVDPAIDKALRRLRNHGAQAC